MGLRSIEILERENLCERAAEMGEYLLGRLQRLLDHPKVGDVRGRGLLLGVEMVKDKASKTPLESAAMATITQYCMGKQMIIGRNTNTIPGFTNVLILCPPLVLPREEADRLADTLYDAVSALPSS